VHFAELRNTIAHGAVINDADWTFEGHAHLDRAHDVHDQQQKSRRGRA
jgi:hypothetical protein